MRVRPVLQQQAHGVDVEGVGGAPERGGAGAVNPEQVAVVGRVPQRPLEPRVDVGPRRQHRPHHVEVRGGLLQVVGRLGMPRLRGPVHVEGAVERGRAGVARQRGVGPRFEEPQGQIEVAVDARDEQGLVPSAALTWLTSGPARGQGQRGPGVAVARREEQRRQPAVGPDEIGVAERLGFSAPVGFRRRGRGSRRTGGRSGDRATRGTPGGLDGRRRGARPADRPVRVATRARPGRRSARSNASRGPCSRRPASSGRAGAGSPPGRTCCGRRCPRRSR